MILSQLHLIVKMENGTIKNKVVLRQQYLFYTVEPPLTATSLGTATSFVLAADSPYIVYCLSLTTTATATKACPQLPK